MAIRPSSFLTVVASCAIALALAIGLAACGSDDDKANAGGDAASGDSKTGTTQATTTGAAEPATDEGQIKALVAGVQKAFTTGDGEVICDSLTARGQRDIVKYGQVTGLSGSCTEVADKLVKRELDMGTKQRPSRVVTVRVRGSRATALIRIAGAATLQQRYRKVDGEWKIGSFNLGAAAGI